MANMSYCRFQNTLSDLEDVYDHLDDTLSRDEHEAREELIRLCTTISREAKSIGFQCEEDEEETDDDTDEEDE